MRARQELLETEDQAWHELCRRFDRVGELWDKPGATGDWTPKDVMAHVASWHAYAVDRLEEFASTGKFTRLGTDVDVYNAELYEQCKDLTLHDVRAMSGASRHRYREEIASLADPIPQHVIELIVANGVDHYAEHLPDLDAFLGEPA